jgi:hypothetical protein
MFRVLSFKKNSGVIRISAGQRTYGQNHKREIPIAEVLALGKGIPETREM